MKGGRPHLYKNKVLFHQDNASEHTSPNLAPCDFHLFPNLKKWLHDSSNFEITAVNGYFEDLNSSTHKEGNATLEHHRNKYVELVEAILKMK